MRSVISCQAKDMDQFFWFWLLLTYLSVTESNVKKENCLTQPVNEIKRKVEEDALLPCTVSENCLDKDMHYKWFVFNEHNHHPITVPSKSPRFRLDGASLHITSLNVNDSGIYHCAAEWTGEPTHGKQHVGLGTTLRVRVQGKPMVKHILLWVSFVLLAIYNLTILTLILVKKFGCNLSICRGISKTDKNNSTNKANTKIQFRDVLQEMYSKKNLPRDTQTADRNLSQAQAASAHFNSSTDDIYQNVSVKDVE